MVTGEDSRSLNMGCFINTHHTHIHIIMRLLRPALLLAAQALELRPQALRLQLCGAPAVRSLQIVRRIPVRRT